MSYSLTPRIAQAQNPDDRMEVRVGDLTKLEADAIVNAANTSLLGGGGVDGAIHRAAGPRLLAHNRTLGGCPTGLAKVTPAFNLQARGIRHIIHTVGPVWSHQDNQKNVKLGHLRDDVLLASCYQQCMTLACELQVRCLGFCAISTGVYQFPKERAARIAYAHVRGFLAAHAFPQQVVFCCFSPADAQVYRQVIATRDQWMAIGENNQEA